MSEEVQAAHNPPTTVKVVEAGPPVIRHRRAGRRPEKAAAERAEKEAAIAAREAEHEVKAVVKEVAVKSAGKGASGLQRAVRQVAKNHNLSRAVVGELIARFPEQVELQQKAIKDKLLVGAEKMIMEGLTAQKLKKASTLQLFTAAGIAIDKANKIQDSLNGVVTADDGEKQKGITMHVSPEIAAKAMELLIRGAGRTIPQKEPIDVTPEVVTDESIS